MTDVTRILDALAKGDGKASGELLPLVYTELRRLAAAKLAREKAGQTLQATDLAHEAYLRLVGDDKRPWDSRRHFFAGAAEAMRRIHIERARRKQSGKHGGGRRRIELEEALFIQESRQDLLDLDEALTRLAEKQPIKADLVKLRFYAGLPHYNRDRLAGAKSTGGEIRFLRWKPGF